MPNTSVGFIGRGSFYREICKHLQDNGYNAYNLMNGNSRYPRAVDTVVNYGLSGEKLTEFLSDSPRGQIVARCRDVKNANIFGDKLQCCEAVRATGVPVPETHNRTERTPIDGSWIVKPKWSFGGRGITPYTGQGVTSGSYFMKRVTDRRYELRVHAAAWLPKDQWLVAKRTHPDGDAHLTWNFHQGGTFANIEQNESNTGVFKRAKVFAEKAINALGLQFGAVDFIVQNGSGELPIWFLEVNMAPGFTTDRTRDFYFMAFKALAEGQSAPVPATPPRTPATPPPAATREMPVASTSRSMTAAKRMTIISWLTSGNDSFEELIAYINTLR